MMQKNLERIKTDIFISYCRETGKQMAGRIRDVFLRKGYVVHMDLHDGKDNVNFRIEKKMLIKSCKDFIIILSANTKDDSPVFEREWVARELCWAIKYNKNIISIKMEDFHWPKDQNGKTKELMPPHVIEEEFGESILRRLRKWPYMNQTTAIGFEESESDYIFQKIGKRLNSQARKKMKVRMCVAIILLLIAACTAFKTSNIITNQKRINQKKQVYDWKLKEIKSRKVDADYLSGTVTDKNKQYKNIKSIFMRIPNKDDNVYIVLDDGTSPYASVEKMNDDEMTISWSTDDENRGLETFKYVNCYPNGFYIVTDDNIYEYGKIAKRSGKYNFKLSNVQKLNNKYEYQELSNKYLNQNKYPNICSAIRQWEFARDNVNFNANKETSWGEYGRSLEDGSLEGCNGTCDNNDIWGVVYEENDEKYFIRNINRKGWEICVLESFPFYIERKISIHTKYNGLFSKKDGAYIIISGFFNPSDRNSRCIYISEDYGASFICVNFDLPILKIEEEFDAAGGCGTFYENHGVYYENVVLRSNYFKEAINSMIVKFNLEEVLDGTAESFEVEEKVFFPSDD